jgi:predicted phage-related endonuclease
MNQPPNEDTTLMIEVQTETIIKLSNELEAAMQRIAELERIIEIHERHDKQLYRIIHNLKEAPNGKD